MKFSPKRDRTMGAIIWSSALFGWLFIPSASIEGWPLFGVLSLLILSSSLLLSFWFRTSYQIEETIITWFNGPFRGTIEIDMIQTIYIGRSMMYLNGFLKPSLTFDSLILQIGKYDEIALGPEDQDGFIRLLQSKKPDIKVINENDPV